MLECERVWQSWSGFFMRNLPWHSPVGSEFLINQVSWEGSVTAVWHQARKTFTAFLAMAIDPWCSWYGSCITRDLRVQLHTVSICSFTRVCTWLGSKPLGPQSACNYSELTLWGTGALGFQFTNQGEENRRVKLTITLYNIHKIAAN